MSAICLRFLLKPDFSVFYIIISDIVLTVLCSMIAYILNNIAHSFTQKHKFF